MAVVVDAERSSVPCGLADAAVRSRSYALGERGELGSMTRATGRRRCVAVRPAPEFEHALLRLFSTSAACSGARGHAAPELVGSWHPVCLGIDRTDEVSCAALVVRRAIDDDLAVVEREPRR
jgi:hypothetical protein